SWIRALRTGAASCGHSATSSASWERSFGPAALLFAPPGWWMYSFPEGFGAVSVPTAPNNSFSHECNQGGGGFCGSTLIAHRVAGSEVGRVDACKAASSSRHLSASLA